ncbi:class I SAM-dependent methyltransferase [Polyangium sorediatum]|uniref:Class I SAM-dependent methyltransferase n=1 Tax=Polyangium sorediatum TaxID=889274 RepID=A0ABT6NNZ7_9BACT|nr:class I SAM-dependent methyltransferase [Polyangium sorediatum]MDI1430023.1 class I SAM-dependent methyltransferase [Polyangium sorediatum]
MNQLALQTLHVSEGPRWELEAFHRSPSYRMDLVALFTMLDELPFRSMLDIGSGAGLVVREARGRHPGRRIDGVERSDFGAGAAARRLRRRYDVMTAVHALNHVPHLDRAAAKMAERLTAGGHVVIVNPNPAFTWIGVEYLDPRTLDSVMEPHGLRRLRRLEYGNELLVYRKN